MNPFENQFSVYWKQYFRKFQSQKILLAVSGGVDSMALFQLLKNAGISFGVAHCNYGLRGEASDADEALVQSVCEAGKIPFHLIRFDTKKIAVAEKTGIQETARTLRYEWFESLCRQHQYAAIATAHHADDSAETVLMNLFRGTGLKGLHGILPVQEKVIRPLLFASKKDLLQYAAGEKISFREDASNAHSDYTRNAIRNEILPVIEAHFPQARRAIAHTAARIAETETLHQAAIEKRRKRLMEPRGNDFYLPIRLWQKTPAAASLLFEFLSPYGFSAATIPEVQKLFSSQPGRYMDLEKYRLFRYGHFLVLTARLEAQPEGDMYLIEEGSEEIVFPQGKLQITKKEVPKNITTTDANAAWLNPAVWEWPLVLRRPKAGDYFYPLGMGGKKKKIARFLMSLKLTATQKEQVWVLESGRRIAWVVGYRIDERFQLKPDQKTAFLVKISS